MGVQSLNTLIRDVMKKRHIPVSCVHGVYDRMDMIMMKMSTIIVQLKWSHKHATHKCVYIVEMSWFKQRLFIIANVVTQTCQTKVCIYSGNELV